MPLARPADDLFSDADSLTWPDGKRWERIDGETWDMTRMPSAVHQRAAGRCSR